MRPALLLLASLGLAEAFPQQVVFSFDVDYAGASGRVLLDYDPDQRSNELTISADLNFRRVDLAALAKAEPKCKGKVTEYTWHIHTKWEQAADYEGWSAPLALCSKANTANHYDPYRSCGPASDYVDSPECAGRAANYKCSPESYMKDPWLCEVGDLSGKFGRWKPNQDGDLKGTWVDKNFPTWMIDTEGWSLVVHAVCGDATPRVSCSLGHLMSSHHHQALAKAAPEETVEDDEESFVPEDETEVESPISYEISNKHLRIDITVQKGDDN